MPLDAIPLGVMFAATIAGILVALELGYRLGRRRNREAKDEKESTVGQMVAAELGLLAFMLAFTFGIAASRFEDRRQVLLDETNAIGTCWLRAEMLPEPQAPAARALLAEYVDIRIKGADEQAIAAALARSEVIHAELWKLAVAAAKSDARSVPIGLFVESLNGVIDRHAERVMAGLRSRIPTTVWIVLYFVTFLAFGAMGYQGGLSGTSRSPAVFALALAFALVIWLVTDLDRPGAGWLQSSQQPLIDLRASMNNPPP